MWRAVRLALMWLLAVAVPLQGLAATTMVNCDSGQVAPASEAASAGEHPHGVTHDVAQQASDQAANTADHDRGDDGADDHSAADHRAAGHSCSACFACCVGAALPTGALLFESVSPTERFAPLVSSRVAAHVGEALERPPRPFLA